MAEMTYPETLSNEGVLYAIQSELPQVKHPRCGGRGYTKPSDTDPGGPCCEDGLMTCGGCRDEAAHVLRLMADGGANDWEMARRVAMKARCKAHRQGMEEEERR